MDGVLRGTVRTSAVTQAKVSILVLMDGVLREGLTGRELKETEMFQSLF